MLATLNDEEYLLVGNIMMSYSMYEGVSLR